MNKILIAALLLEPPALHAQLRGSASAKRRELANIQRQLEQKKKEIDEFRREADSAKHDMSRLAGQASSSRRKVQQLEDKIREAQKMKAELKERLGALQLAENQWQDVLKDELASYHRQRMRQFDYFGRGELWEESFRRSAIAEKSAYVEGLHGYRKKAEAAATAARKDASKLLLKSETARAEYQSRESLYRQKKEAYLESRQKLAQTQRAVQELQDSALALTHLLRALEKKTAPPSSPYRPKMDAALSEPPHSFPWPVEGRIVRSFGKQLVPELNTWVIHQGIRMTTESGSVVKVVKSGKIIFVGPFRSYGQVMIVDHGGAFYTIYGLLGETFKRKGDRVRASEPLASVGRPESGEGGTFYFEMRQSGDALDPMHWLQRRSEVVIKG